MWIDIFRTGTHTDSKGRTRTFTEEDLDRIVKKYDPQHHEAPVVVGHPKDNSPAYGWVETLKREGDRLRAKLRDLAPEFKEWVKSGRYKKRSMSIYPDGALRHVGFLGAMPPAVKGLEDAAFAESEYEEFEFEEFKYRAIADVFRQLREWLIEKFSKEDADRVVRDWEIESIKETGGSAEAQAFMESTTTKEEGTMTEEKTYTEEDLRRARDEAKRDAAREYSEKISSLDEEKRKKEEELAALREEKRRSEIESLCEGLVKEGRLTPAEVKMGIVEFMKAIEDDGAEEAEFSEGGKKTPAEWFRDYLLNRGKVVEFREIAGGETDIPATDEAKRERLIEDYMEKHEGCDYKTAMFKVSNQHPELFELGKEAK